MLRKVLTRSAALRHFLRQARAVRRATGKGVLAQVMELRWLKRRTGLSGREYFLYELHRKDLPREEKAQYLTRELHERYLAPLDPISYGALIADKFIFKQFFASLGFPVCRWYGVYHPFHGRTASGEPLRNGKDLHRLLTEVTAPGLVIKPARGGSGSGVLVFASRAPRTPATLVHVNGDEYPCEKIASLLAPQNPLVHPGYLLEERVEQHPLLARFIPTTLNTVRVVTLMADDGSVHVVGASLKIGTDNSGVESLADHHLCAPVDLDSGRLGTAAHLNGLKFDRLAHHPVNQERIEGMVLPHWPEVKQLALRAAEAARCVRSIGWDIGLSAQGPVLIEGNETWGEEILQIALGRGIWAPPFRALIGAPPGLAARG
jgi:hypothetical protein